jgi:hypothetical protein
LLDLAVDDEKHGIEKGGLGAGTKADLIDNRPDLFDQNGLSSLVSVEASGYRPFAGDRLENWAASRGDSSDANRIAAAYWNAFAYRYVPPESGTTVEFRDLPVQEVGICSQTVEDPVRWLVSEGKTVEFSVDVPNGVYALSNVVSLSKEPGREQYISIDGVQIPVHAGAGLPSRVAIASGPHRFSSGAFGATVGLEVTAGMIAPCSSLRRRQVWSRVRPATFTRFILPAPGAASIVRLRLESNANEANVTVVIGDRRIIIQKLTKSSSVLEFGIGSDEDHLAITADSDIGVNVGLRRQSGPTVEPDRLNINVSSDAAPHQLLRPLTNFDLPNAELRTKLTELRALSASLHAAAQKSDRHLTIERRAALLTELGYRKLALRDVTVDSSVEGASDFAYISGASAHVIPLGLISQIAPLPLPKNLDGLIVRRMKRVAEGDAACSEDIPGEALSRSDAETLLLAYCAERSSQNFAAAILYESIARSTNNGSLFLRAASLHADTGINTSDFRPTITAGILATLAKKTGVDPSGLWARLERAISWPTVSMLDGVTGYVSLSKTKGSERSLKELVSSALSESKPGGITIEPAQHAELVFDSQKRSSIVIEHGCDDERGERCQLRVLLDGIPIDCNVKDNECDVPTATGTHRLEMSFTGISPIGWVMVRGLDKKLSPQIRTLWHELDANRVAQLTIKGPTIVRLRLRSRNVDETQLAPDSIRISGCGIDKERYDVKLANTQDEFVKTMPEGERSSVGTEVIEDIPIEMDARCQLSFLSKRNGVLVQVAAARAADLPKERLQPQKVLVKNPAMFLERSPSTQTLLAPVKPTHLVESFPLFLEVRERLLSESLTALAERDSVGSERSFQDVFAESSVIVAKELVENRLWGTAQVGGRMRFGPMTKLGRVSLEMPSQRGLPGIELQGNTYSQTFEGNNYTSLGSTTRINLVVPLSSNHNLVPQLGYTNILLPSKPATTKPVDGDVHSSYFASHPHYVTMDFSLKLRPFVDVMSVVATSVRSLPDLSGLDRVTVTADLWFLPKNEWPLMFTTGWFSSYRPESNLRDQYFVRHQFNLGASFWNWITPSERIRIYAQLDCFFDAPTSSKTTLYFAPTITIDLSTSGNRGLRDLSSQQVPFKAFQERGSGRSHPNQSERLQSYPYLD